MTFGTANDGLQTGQQLGLVKRLGQVIVGAVAQSLDLFVGFGQAGKNQHRCIDLGGAQALQNFVPIVKAENIRK